MKRLIALLTCLVLLLSFSACERDEEEDEPAADPNDGWTSFYDAGRLL